MIKFYLPRDKETNKLLSPRLSFDKTTVENLFTVYELWLGFVVITVIF